MHANDDPTHRGHGTRLPNNTGRHDLERHPATAYPHIQPLSAPSGTVPSGTLAKTRATHTARRQSPDMGVDLENHGANDAECATTEDLTRWEDSCDPDRSLLLVPTCIAGCQTRNIREDRSSRETFVHHSPSNPPESPNPPRNVYTRDRKSVV